MSSITRLPCITTVDIPADTILESAVGKLENAMVIGWDHDGNLYVASTSSKPSEAAWLMENAKQFLLELVK